MAEPNLDHSHLVQVTTLFTEKKRRYHLYIRIADAQIANFRKYRYGSNLDFMIIKNFVDNIKNLS